MGVVPAVVVDRFDNLHLPVAVDVDQHRVGARCVVVGLVRPNGLERERIEPMHHAFGAIVVSRTREQIPAAVAVDVHGRGVAAALHPARPAGDEAHVVHVEANQILRSRAQVAVENAVVVGVDDDGRVAHLGVVGVPVLEDSARVIEDVEPTGVAGEEEDLVAAVAVQIVCRNRLAEAGQRCGPQGLSVGSANQTACLVGSRAVDEFANSVVVEIDARLHQRERILANAVLIAKQLCGFGIKRRALDDGPRRRLLVRAFRTGVGRQLVGCEHSVTGIIGDGDRVNAPQRVTAKLGIDQWIGSRLTQQRQGERAPFVGILGQHDLVLLDRKTAVAPAVESVAETVGQHVSLGAHSKIVVEEVDFRRDVLAFQSRTIEPEIGSELRSQVVPTLTVLAIAIGVDVPIEGPFERFELSGPTAGRRLRRARVASSP